MTGASVISGSGLTESVTNVSFAIESFFGDSVAEDSVATTFVSSVVAVFISGLSVTKSLRLRITV